MLISIRFTKCPLVFLVDRISTSGEKYRGIQITKCPLNSLHPSKRPKQELQTQLKKRNQHKYNPNVKKGDLCFDLVGHFVIFISS